MTPLFLFKWVDEYCRIWGCGYHYVTDCETFDLQVGRGLCLLCLVVLSLMSEYCRVVIRMPIFTLEHVQIPHLEHVEKAFHLVVAPQASCLKGGQLYI